MTKLTTLPDLRSANKCWHFVKKVCCHFWVAAIFIVPRACRIYRWNLLRKCMIVQLKHKSHQQEAQLSPRDRAMRRINWNLANCHATVQKLLIRQVLTKSMVWSWRFSRRQCVIDNVHSTMTQLSRLPLSQVSWTNRRRWVVYITCLPTTCCGEIF